jgi:hypothetical protein
MKMDSVDRFAVLASIGDECIKEVEIQVLLKGKATPVCYVWFEPSSEMTIAEVCKIVYVPLFFLIELAVFSSGILASFTISFINKLLC